MVLVQVLTAISRFPPLTNNFCKMDSLLTCADAYSVNDSLVSLGLQVIVKYVFLLGHMPADSKTKYAKVRGLACYGRTGTTTSTHAYTPHIIDWTYSDQLL